MKKTGWLIIFTVLLLAALTVSCSKSEFSGFKRNYAGTNTTYEITGTYEFLDGTQTKTIGVKPGDVLLFSYSSTVEKGSLTLTLQDTEGHMAMEFPVDTSGEAYFKAEKIGNLKVVINGDDTQGSFGVSWEINKK